MKSAKLLAIITIMTGLAALPLHAASTGHFERTLQVNGQVEMDVSTGSGNITVHQGGAGSISIAAKIHGNTSSWLFGGGNVDERIHKIEQNPPIVQQGNIIHIGKSDDRELFRNISIDYDITVPAQTRLSSYSGSGDQNISGTQLPLTAKTGSGNMTIERVTADARITSGSGDLRINSVKGFLFAETGSGNIHADDIAGEVSTSTGSGNIEVHETSTGNVKAEAGSGNIKLYGLQGGLRADSGSGDIHAEGEPKGDWHLSAGSGNITLKVPSQASFNIDARTSSGSLKVNHPVTMQGSVAHSHIQGKVGNGGVLLDLHTGSGDIQVD